MRRDPGQDIRHHYVKTDIRVKMQSLLTRALSRSKFRVSPYFVRFTNGGKMEREEGFFRRHRTVILASGVGSVISDASKDDR